MQYAVEAIFPDEVHNRHFLTTKEELLKTIRTTWCNRTVEIVERGYIIQVINSLKVQEGMFTLIKLDPLPDHF